MTYYRKQKKQTISTNGSLIYSASQWTGFYMIETSVMKELKEKFCFFTAKKCPYSDCSVPHFPAFGLNAERYRVSLRIQSECGKMRTRITPNMDNFRAVFNSLNNK